MFFPSNFSKKSLSGKGLLLFFFLITAALTESFAAAPPAMDPITTINPAQSLPAARVASGNKTEVLQKISLSEVHGEVFIRREGGFLYERITESTRVRMGDSIKTGEGTCVLEMENHTSLTLQAGTILQIDRATFDRLTDSRATVLKLDMGRLKAKIGKLSQGSKFEVLTPTALAAVRGTIFYLDAGTALGKLFTELYVDESSGGVTFRNTKTGDEFLIPKFGASTAFQDGSLLAPRFMNENERKDFIDQWESAVNQVLGQQGVEEQNTGTGTSSTEDQDSDTQDADQDRSSEQNVSGSALEDFIRRLLEALSDNAGPAEWSFDAVKYDEGTSPLFEETDNFRSTEESQEEPLTKPSGPGDAGIVSDDRNSAETTEDLEVLRERERSLVREEIRREIGRIEADLNFEDKVAQFEKTLDAQTGKVFTDVHGNRVRVDQYIFKPSERSVEFLSLTLRTAEGDLQGISSAAFGVDFNRDITEPLKDLPWSDYFNVVSREEMAVKLGIPENISEGGRNPDFDALAEQYVVHQSDPGLAQGAETDALYPEHFYVEFSNPARTIESEGGPIEVRDRVRFDEVYGAPEDAADFGGQTVQGKTIDSTRISPAEGTTITLISRGNNNSNDPELYLDGQLSFQAGDEKSSADLTVERGDRVYTFSRKDNDGGQTGGFSGDVNESEPFKGVNFYQNNFADQEGEHPAIFKDRLRYGYDYDYDEEMYTFEFDKALIGMFIPIDNQGRVLQSDAPDGSGFRLRGLRDLLSPNPHINGGNYNLEVIFAYGDVVEEDGIDTFNQDFVIDTIITPEIFNGTGALNTVNHSQEFPASLDDGRVHKDDNTWHDYGLDE